jgi:hypothetical protein
MDVTSQHEVLQDRHMLEKLNILETSRDTQPGDLMGFEVSYVSRLEDYFSRLGSVETIDDIVETALASTIGTDDGEYFSPSHLEADSPKSRYPAEAQGYLIALQDDFFFDATFAHRSLLQQTDLIY